MENASKALLIAGAILICILLIAVAMYIYNSATSSLDTAVNKMSSQDKDMYNAAVKPYIGDSIKGSAVKTMIDEVISSNLGNVGQTGKFISVLTKGNEGKASNNNKLLDNTVSKLTNWNKGADLLNACQKANYYDGSGDNNTANVNAATQVMQELKAKINSSKNYKVTADYEQGVVIRVHIGQLND